MQRQSQLFKLCRNEIAATTGFHDSHTCDRFKALSTHFLCSLSLSDNSASIFLFSPSFKMKFIVSLVWISRDQSYLMTRPWVLFLVRPLSLALCTSAISTRLSHRNPSQALPTALHSQFPIFLLCRTSNLCLLPLISKYSPLLLSVVPVGCLHTLPLTLT
jgi:hypothetical protein